MLQRIVKDVTSHNRLFGGGAKVTRSQFIGRHGSHNVWHEERRGTDVILIDVYVRNNMQTATTTKTDLLKNIIICKVTVIIKC